MNDKSGEVTAVFHRTKSVTVFPSGDDGYLIEAVLLDELHDVRLTVEVDYPGLTITAASSEVRNVPVYGSLFDDPP